MNRTLRENAGALHLALEVDWVSTFLPSRRFKSSQAHHTGTGLTLCRSGPRPLLSPTA
jgi:hypothetical protein